MLNMIATHGSHLLARVLTLAILSAVFVAPALADGKDCGVFTLTLVSNGVAVRTFTTPTKIVVPAGQIAPGSTLQVRGKFVRFNISLDTLTVLNYTLTGTPAPAQITNVQTLIFTNKTPLHGIKLTGSLKIQLNTSGQNLVLERGGPGIDSVKIQAKDCDQGGLFQMEPEPGMRERNTLSQGFWYCYQASPTSRRFFTNSVVLGYDSPQDARVVSKADKVTLWSVADGG
ncbi:MAG TPA: hypothetical protein VE842_00005, partial [Pyrinomonadaceae bacterium]|nr:hypothetical protein [Pyrinomonadaceae bacterium]